MATFLHSLAAILVAQAMLPDPQSPRGPGQHPVFSSASIRRTAAAVAAAAQADPRSDWARVRALAPGAEITVISAGQSPLAGRLVSADDTGLTLRLASTGGVTAVGRASVTEIRRLTGRRGSKLGAVVGAGAGAFAGFLVAVNTAYKDCGGSCRGEKTTIGLALVGLPIAGGFAGYHLFARPAGIEVVYIRPML